MDVWDVLDELDEWPFISFLTTVEDKTEHPAGVFRLHLRRTAEIKNFRQLIFHF